MEKMKVKVLGKESKKAEDSGGTESAAKKFKVGPSVG